MLLWGGLLLEAGDFLARVVDEDEDEDFQRRDGGVRIGENVQGEVHIPRWLSSRPVSVWHCNRRISTIGAVEARKEWIARREGDVEKTVFLCAIGFARLEISLECMTNSGN